MILTEKHVIKRNKDTKELIARVDGYCAAAKDLYNAVNYLVSQCNRIHYLLKRGEILDSEDKAYVYRINCLIYGFNQATKGKKANYIDETWGILHEGFLKWYLKTTKEFKAMPYASSAAVVIENVCDAWLSYFKSMKAYGEGRMTKRPRRPGYLDEETGRWRITVSGQKCKLVDGMVSLPRFLAGIHIRTSVAELRQVRFLARSDKLIIEVLHRKEEEESPVDKTKAMAIDLGVNNLATLVSNTDMEPIIINGRPLKSINYFYTKRVGELQSKSPDYETKRLRRTHEKRNNKVKDYMHKASRKIVNIAKENHIGTIIVGYTDGWKRERKQNEPEIDTSAKIPFLTLVEQIKYKAQLEGIAVVVVDENYTSGTSYLDNEPPTVEYFDKSRRISRGQFEAEDGTIINADVNAAYQIMKRAGGFDVPIKVGERVTRINLD